jgi:hypothetical protein
LINAFCDGNQLTASNGYFTTNSCSNNLQLINTVDGAILYSLVKVSLPLVSIVKLNRFDFATIQFQRTKNITSDMTLTLNANITLNANTVTISIDNCTINSTNALQLTCPINEELLQFTVISYTIQLMKG